MLEYDASGLDTIEVKFVLERAGEERVWKLEFLKGIWGEGERVERKEGEVEVRFLKEVKEDELIVDD